MWPTPPTPITAEVVPGVRRVWSRLTAWIAVRPASACGATCRRLDPVRQRHERPLVDEHVVGEAAVHRQAVELVPVAVHVQAAAAVDAEPAAVRRIDEHRVAGPTPWSRRRRPRAPSRRSRDRARSACAARPAPSAPPVACRSVAQTPAPPTLTTTSRGATGSGSGSSISSSGRWYSWSCAAPSPCSTRWSASRVASAMIVSDGLTESVRGISELSPTYRRLDAVHLPFRSTPSAPGRRPSGRSPGRASRRSRSRRPALRRPPRRTSWLNSRAASSRSSSRGVEGDVEALRAVLADHDRRRVLVVHHREHAVPVAVLRAASTRRLPQNGPSSSRSVVANAIGSWIVDASITKPPSSSCWWPMKCDEIGYVMCASCGSSNSP